MSDQTMPGTIRLLRISVLLPIVSMLLLGLTRIWQAAKLPDLLILLLVAVSMLPAAVVWLPWFERRLGIAYLPSTLAVYLASQTLLTSLLQNLGLVRFDAVQLGRITVVEPGVLLMIPLLLIAWQYGWRGALLASASAGTLHLTVGVLLHWLAPGFSNLAPAVPLLRPDLLYFLPLLVAYLGSLLRKQQRLQQHAQVQLREYAAAAEVLAAGRERQRLAARLQATLARSLAALSEQIDTISAALHQTPESAAEKLTIVQSQMHDNIHKTQQVIDELQARPLDDLGLVEAIRRRVDALTERHGIEARFEANGQPDGLTAEQELVLYHIADQALDHVTRHENVQHVQLNLMCMADQVALTVHDDGKASTCNGHGHSAHCELDDIVTCAQLIGGVLCVDSEGASGTTVACWLPYGRPS